MFFEAPHRTAAALAAMAEAFGADRPAAVCRELTKTHEEVRRGPLGDLVGWAEDGVRGEVTIVVSGATAGAGVAQRRGLAPGRRGRRGGGRASRARTPFARSRARAGVPKRRGVRRGAPASGRSRRDRADDGAARRTMITDRVATGSGRRCPSRSRTRSWTTTATSTSPTAMARDRRGARPRRGGRRTTDRADRLRPPWRALGRRRRARARRDRGGRGAASQRGPPARRGGPPRRGPGRDRAAGRGARQGARGRGDRARPLPHRPRGPGRAGGVVRAPHRPGQAARQDPGHPRPRRPRRRARRDRRGGCARALGDALLLRQPALRPGLPRPRRLPELRRHGHVQERPAAARRAGRHARSTGCWSRPTRRS